MRTLLSVTTHAALRAWVVVAALATVLPVRVDAAGTCASVGGGNANPPANVVAAPDPSDGGLTLTFEPSCDEQNLGIMGYAWEESVNGAGFAPVDRFIPTNDGGPVSFTMPLRSDGMWSFQVYAVTNASLARRSTSSPSSVPVLVDATPPNASVGASLSYFYVNQDLAHLYVNTGPVDDPIAGNVSSGPFGHMVLIDSPNVSLGPTETLTSVLGLDVPTGYTYTVRVWPLDRVLNAGPITTRTIPIPGPATHFELQGLGESQFQNPASAFAGKNYPVKVVPRDRSNNLAQPYVGRWVRFAVDGGQPPPALPNPSQYQFQSYDDGGHTFDQGVKFNSAGWYLVSVYDPYPPSAVRADVWVEVLSAGAIRIDHDANPRATPGQPYQYNDAGMVSGHSTDALTYSKCDGISAFSVDSVGHVSWLVAPHLEGQTLHFCVQANAAQNAAPAQYDFDVTVSYLDGGLPDIPDAGHRTLEFEPACGCSAGSMAPMLAMALLAFAALRRAAARRDRSRTPLD